MRMPPFFLLESECFFSRATFKLDAEKVHHLRNVLRKKGKIEAIFADGSGVIREGTIDENNFVHFISDPLEVRKNFSSLKTTLMTSLVKNKSMEILLQKGTELGIDSFVIFSSEHSVLSSPLKLRWKKIIESAMAQSRNPFLPSIEFSKRSFLDFYPREFQFCILGDICPESIDVATFLQKPPVLESFEEVIFFVGPEGGFSNAEAKHLRSFSQSVSLGSNILRTETAAICGMFLLKMLTKGFPR